MELIDEFGMRGSLWGITPTLLKCLDCTSELHASRGDSITSAYIRGATDFLTSLSSQTPGRIPSDADRDRLFGFTYRAWLHFLQETDLPAEDSSRHLETAQNGAHYVFSLVRQIFVAIGEDPSVAWIDSLEPHFVAYFVSRRLHESLRETAANDERAPVSLPDTQNPVLRISSPLAMSGHTFPPTANQNAWSHSFEMLKALSLIMKQSSSSSGSNVSTGNNFSVIQNIALVGFIRTVETRLNYDDPREVDYTIFFVCVFQTLHGIAGPALEDELREDGGKRVVPIGVQISNTLKQMFDWLGMKRYSRWIEEVPDRFEAYLQAESAKERSRSKS